MAAGNAKRRERPKLDRRKKKATQCAKTGKVSYASSSAALGGAAGLGSSTGKRVRTYICEHCGFWHLTTKPGPV